MTLPVLGYWDYVKAAFHLKVPVGPLGALPLNKLLLTGAGILGFGNPGFWLLGLAFETAYLLYLPGSPRFQKVISGRQLLAIRNKQELQRKSFLDSLSVPSRRRYEILRSTSNFICSSGNVEDPENVLDELKAARLNDLLMVFAKLLASKEKIQKTLDGTSQKDLDQDIALLERKISLETEDSILKRSLQSSLDIQKRRLENLKKADHNLKVVEAELGRIEKQTALLAEENQIGADPAAFSERLDKVTNSLEETNRWMTENAQLLTTLGVEGTKSKKSLLSE